MSIWLLRNAYDAGTLAATQPGITLIDPVTSTALGCWLSATASIVAGSWAAAEPPLAVITASVLVLGRFAVLQPPGGQLAGARRPAGRAGGGKTAAVRPRSG
jgi:hypothetical protein